MQLFTVVLNIYLFLWLMRANPTSRALSILSRTTTMSPSARSSASSPSSASSASSASSSASSPSSSSPSPSPSTPSSPSILGSSSALSSSSSSPSTLSPPHSSTVSLSSSSPTAKTSKSLPITSISSPSSSPSPSSRSPPIKSQTPVDPDQALVDGAIARASYRPQLALLTCYPQLRKLSTVHLGCLEILGDAAVGMEFCLLMTEDYPTATRSECGAARSSCLSNRTFQRIFSKAGADDAPVEVVCKGAADAFEIYVECLWRERPLAARHWIRDIFRPLLTAVIEGKRQARSAKRAKIAPAHPQNTAKTSAAQKSTRKARRDERRGVKPGKNGGKTKPPLKKTDTPENVAPHGKDNLPRQVGAAVTRRCRGG
ncbi:hypothetical protein B0H11DRAFT_2040893 [Mycena galericulata]|nr:hypothetical protein B0H11DRAFT_2040893 [Mycena galericulata]